MALSRATIKEILSKAGVTAENMDAAISGILEGHTASVDALTELRDKYKADADKLPGVQAELAAAKENAKGGDKDAWKVKYDALKGEYDTFKADTAQKETNAQKQTAYKALLDELKISGKVTDKVLKLAELDKVELVDGKIKDADALKKALSEEWKDFIVTSGTEGARVETPPASGGETVTKEQFDKMGYAARNELYQKQPELYKTLTKKE